MCLQLRNLAADGRERHAEAAGQPPKGCPPRLPSPGSTSLRGDPFSKIRKDDSNHSYRLLDNLEGTTFSYRPMPAQTQRRSPMSRIPTPATIEAAPPAAQPLLEAVKKQLGVVPNLFRLVSNSPAALEGYLGLSGALDKGSPAGADARAHRARGRRDQRLQLLPVGAHLSRQEPRQARRRRDHRQPQRRLERPQGRCRGALCGQSRARTRPCQRRRSSVPSRLPATTMRR